MNIHLYAEVVSENVSQNHMRIPVLFSHSHSALFHGQHGFSERVCNSLPRDRLGHLPAVPGKAEVANEHWLSPWEYWTMVTSSSNFVLTHTLAILVSLWNSFTMEAWVKSLGKNHFQNPIKHLRSPSTPWSLYLPLVSVKFFCIILNNEANQQRPGNHHKTQSCKDMGKQYCPNNVLENSF
jgi:hypothetical protein